MKIRCITVILVIPSIYALWQIVKSRDRLGAYQLRTIPQATVNDHIGQTMESRGHEHYAWCQGHKPRNLTEKAISSPGVFNSILVDDVNKYLYCFVPKVGCSTWKGLFIKMRYGVTLNRQKVHNSWYTKRTLLSTYKPREILTRLESYYKFMFVRHPLERLLSAFNEKFVDGLGGDPPFISLAEEIFEIPKSLDGNRNISEMRNRINFGKFVEHTIAIWNSNGTLNPHWRPMWDLCHPCDIHYDFIGRFETMWEDSNYVLQHGLSRTDVYFPAKSELSADDKRKWSRNNTDKLEKQLQLLPEQVLGQIREVYSRDFQTFSYA